MSLNSRRIYTLQNSTSFWNVTENEIHEPISELPNDSTHQRQIRSRIRPIHSSGKSRNFLDFRQDNGAILPINRQQNDLIRQKIVYKLNCTYCGYILSHRAMKAILLADTKIELFSTDLPPQALKLLDEDKSTSGCRCKIRDTVCNFWYFYIHDNNLVEI